MEKLSKIYNFFDTMEKLPKEEGMILLVFFFRKSKNQSFVKFCSIFYITFRIIIHFFEIFISFNSIRVISINKLYAIKEY